MPETPEEKKQRKLRELEGKNIEYYSTMLSAWIDNKMEYDKTLITLSSMAIGLIVTLLTTIGINATYEFIIFIIAFISFTTTILTALIIFHLNTKIIEDSLKENTEQNYNIKKFDRLIIGSFIIGMISTMLFATSHAYHSYNKKNNIPVNKDHNSSEKNVTIENLNTKKVNSMPNEKNNNFEKTSLSIANESIDGINKLNPENIQQDSIEGISQFNPEDNASDNSTQSSQDSNES